jgi:hypothetical protein
MFTPVAVYANAIYIFVHDDFTDPKRPIFRAVFLQRVKASVGKIKIIARDITLPCRINNDPRQLIHQILRFHNYLIEAVGLLRPTASVAFEVVADFCNRRFLELVEDFAIIFLLKSIHFRNNYQVAFCRSLADFNRLLSHRVISLFVVSLYYPKRLGLSRVNSKLVWSIA